MTLTAKDSKMAVVRESVNNVLNAHPTVDAKAVASMIGCVIALEPALGPMTQLLT